MEDLIEEVERHSRELGMQVLKLSEQLENSTQACKDIYFARTGFGAIAAAFNQKYYLEQKLQQAQEALTENVNHMQTLRNQNPLPKVRGSWRA